jgi:hypothetical protein
LYTTIEIHRRRSGRRVLEVLGCSTEGHAKRYVISLASASEPSPAIRAAEKG